jgi:DNA-binding NtrC family response regulator
VTFPSGLPTNSNPIVSALSVSPDPADHESLRRLVPEQWNLFRADGLPSALRVLHKQDVGVVLCERDLPHANWRDMLEHLVMLDEPPSLIVTSRSADEQLWAEALNLGAYDVLVKPFDVQELHRTVQLAWLHWYERRAAAAPRVSKTFVAGRG